jgi:hypothetical protein
MGFWLADPFFAPYHHYPGVAGLYPHQKGSVMIATHIAIVPYKRFYEVFV